MKTKPIAIASVVLVLITVVVLLRSRMEGRAPSRPPQPVEGSAPPTASGQASEPLAVLEGRAPARPSAPSVEPEGPITATAQITRGDKTTVDAKALDGEFARIHGDPNEVLTIRLALNGFDPTQEIRIDADNGGSLNRKIGPLTLASKGSGQPIEFQYALGKHRGRYTLFITQGQRQEFMEFWVGPESPRGAAGPMREFNRDKI